MQMLAPAAEEFKARGACKLKKAIWKHEGVMEGMSKVRMRARGAICVVAALGAVNKGYYI